jgi:hypothetical protein
LTIGLGFIDDSPDPAAFLYEVSEFAELAAGAATLTSYAASRKAGLRYSPVNQGLAQFFYFCSDGT